MEDVPIRLLGYRHFFSQISTFEKETSTVSKETWTHFSGRNFSFVKSAKSSSASNIAHELGRNHIVD